ncbi:MAG: hypothetical protein RIQ47_1511 [Bacteroidota bacterium]|jgi:hypothetical protein
MIVRLSDQDNQPSEKLSYTAKKWQKIASVAVLAHFMTKPEHRVST